MLPISNELNHLIVQKFDQSLIITIAHRGRFKCEELTVYLLHYVIMVGTCLQL